MQTFSAPGKLLLFGEHSAVFGYPALGLALHQRLAIDVEPASGYAVRIPRRGRPIDPNVLHAFATHIEKTVAHCSPAVFHVHSELPVESGFGSSAALCTAIARWALEQSEWKEIPRSKAEAAWSLAHRLEHFFHGTPSGIDTGLSALAGVRAFHFDRGPGKLPSSHGVSGPIPPLVVGSIPRERSTRELVASVRGRLESSPKRVRPLLDRLGALCEEALTRLSVDTHPDRGPSAANRADIASEVASLADQAQVALRSLGVSTSKTDALLDLGRASGALGGKLSGAGGGGAFYLVCATVEHATTVLERIRERLPAGGVAFTHVESRGGSGAAIESRGMGPR